MNTANLFAKNTSDLCSSCNAPSYLSVSDVTSTSVTLQWNENNTPNATLWDVEVVSYGDLPTNLPTANNITANPFVLNNLTTGSRYQFYVRARCVGEAPSAWAGPYTFFTLLPNPTACGIGMSIPDNSCSSANEFLVDVNTPIGNQLGDDVIIEEVKIIINHPWVADMEIYLTAPSGVRVELSTDNGNSGDHYGDPFDTTCGTFASFVAGECGTPDIESSMTPFVGKYTPENSLTDFNDGSDPNGIWMLEICDDAGSDTGTLEFFEIVYTSNTCFQPTNLTATNIGATTIDLNWNEGGTCTETIVEYGPAGFIPGSCGSANGGSLISIPCPVPQPYSIAGLSASTNYDFYIREDCGNGNCSVNTCPVSLTTDCLTMPISESEDFDNQVICQATCGTPCPILGNWFNAAGSDFDWIVSTATTPSFNTGPSKDVSSTGNYIYLETSGGNCSGGKQAELRSNCISVNSGSGSCHLSFHTHIFGTTIGMLMLEITTDGGANWTNLLTKSGGQGDFWEKNYVDLSAYDGQIVQFRFLGISGTGYTGDIAIDEVTFYGSTSIGVPQNVFYLDADSDGYGNLNAVMQSCSTVIPSGYVANGDDCNDQDASINPGAPELNCNGQDENCNGNNDDSIFPAPSVNTAVVCQGETTTLTPTLFPTGAYYWFNSPSANTPIATGNNFTTPVLNNNTTYYLVDSTITFPGLRISEVDLGADDIIEIQNIGDAANYTGWSVLVSNSYTNINAVNAVQWDLGNMTSNEIDFRTDNAATGANYLGNNIIWNAGSYPNFAGWALIVDNVGQVVDALFWGWQSGAISNFDIIVNGFNITNSDLPWSGNGINVSAGCGQGNSILLTGNNETNTANDYANCSAASIGNPNANLNLMRVCKSGRIPVHVEVDDEPSLVMIGFAPTICAGTDFDLSSVGFYDANDAHGITSYHTGTPTTAANYIATPIVNPTTTTTYYIRSSTAFGCYDEIPITVDVNNSMNVGINPVGTINACDGSNKTITGLTLGSGTAPYTYLWNTGATTESITADPNPQGGMINYEVTITDANGCFGVASMNINSYTMSASIDNVGPVSSCNAADGNITLTPFGTAPYSYNWTGPNSGSSSGVMTSFSIPNLVQGAYRVTISDSGGCVLVIPQTLLSVGGPAANATLISTSNISCPNANDGAIDIEITGNNPTAIWSHGSTAEDLTGLAPGSYDVTVSDGQCTSILSGIVIAEPDPIAINVNAIKLPNCVGDNSGAIEIEVAGGATPYNFVWSNGRTTKDIAGITSGDYNVTITDAADCSVIMNLVTVEDPQPLSIFIDEARDIDCFGNNDGRIDITVNGGATPYTFDWSNGSDTEDVNSLLPNNYQVTVTDANGCVAISSTTIISENTLLYSSANEVRNIDCNGDLSGFVTISTTGGSSPYQYLWNNGSTAKDQVGLSAGIYNYTVTDAKGCYLISPSIQIEEASVLNVTIDDINNITCTSGTNGYIQMSTSGGVPPYTYAWSHGQQIEDANDLPVGDYELTVTDANGCDYISTVINLNDDDAFETNIVQVQQITCYGAKDGQVDVEVSGGLEPYAYFWNNGQQTEDLNNIEPGMYIVTILDAGGCTNIHSTTISEPIPLQPEVMDLQHVTCQGEADAMIQIFTNGGIAPLTYTWSNGDSGSMATNLEEGFYDVTVTDAFGCEEVLQNIPVIEPSGIFIDVASFEPINCVGATDGLIDILVIGGVAPYTYEWSNGNVTEDLINVGADDYSLTLTDANGCQQFVPVISIFEPQSALNTNDIVKSDVSCYDAVDGQVIVSIFGGMAPYQYNWSAGQNNISSELSDTISNLIPGTYDVTVTDANGCIHVSPSTIITEPTAVIITLDEVIHNDCNNDAIGQIDITTFGGQSPYTFHWSNGNANEDQVNLTNGNYSLFVEDAIGCISETISIDINQPGVNLAYNLNIVDDVTCFQAANGVINVTSFGGTAPYLYQWNNGETTAILNNLSGGQYYATVIDANGCQQYIDTIEVLEAALELEIGLLEIYGNACVDDAEGRIDIAISGGMPPYDVAWSNNDASESIENLEGGIYNATITDALGCVVLSPNYFVDEPAAFDLDMITVGSPSNMNIGSLQVVVNGGTAPYQYQWDENANNQTTSLASDLSPGVYHVTITDSNNCTITYNGAVGFTTALENELGVNTFEIFPNPTSESVNLKIEMSSSNSFVISIRDLSGKTIEYFNVSSTSSFSQSINLSSLSQGVYILEMELSEQEILQKKLVVLK